MPVATAVPAAAMALSRAILEGECDQSVRLEMTAQYADMMAAFDRREALDLELRDESGRVIETEWIDIRDIEALLQRVDNDPFADWESNAGYDPQLEADIELDMQTIDEWSAKADDNIADGHGHDFRLDDDDDFECEAWRGTEAMAEFPRYQIGVVLRNAADIP